MRTSPYARTAEALCAIGQGLTCSTGISPRGVATSWKIAAKGSEMSGASQEEIDLRLHRLARALMEAANESDGLAVIQIEDELDPSAFFLVSATCRGLADKVFPPQPASYGGENVAPIASHPKYRWVG